MVDEDRKLQPIKDVDSERAFLFQAIYNKAQGDLLRKPSDLINAIDTVVNRK